MKKLLLFLFIVMSGAMSATTIKNRDAGPTDVAVTISNSICGTPNGVIQFGAVTGGVAPYVYSIDGGTTFSSTTIYTGLFGGSYPIAVKDSNGDVYTSTAIVINESGPSSVSISLVDETCGNANGSITLGTVTGGTAPFEYQFNGSGGYTSTTNYTNLTEGSYTIEIKDANGCIYTTVGTLINNAGPTAIATTIVDASCGQSNGSLMINSVTGGTAPYEYSVFGSMFSSTTTYSGFPAGTDIISVKDANGCIYTTSFSISNMPGPTAVATTIVNASCGASNGSIIINNVTGGTAPFLYAFNNLPYSSTTSYNNFPAASIPLEVKDANGCIFVTTIIIIDTPGPTAISSTIVKSNCGASNGSITLGAVSGGTAPYTYGFNIASGVGPYSATTTYGNLEAGCYPIDVKDANGCLFYTTVCIANSDGPTAIDTTITNSSCATANGSITLGAVTGGTAPYTFNFNGLGFPGPLNYSGLVAGCYPLQVKDANGCLFITSICIINTDGPTAIDTTVINASCGEANGSITLGAVTGGTAPYQFDFNYSGFTAAVTTYSGLSAGTYLLTVKDANGCIFYSEITVLNERINLTINGVYNDYNADGFTNVGDIINYQFTVSNTGTLDVTNVTLANSFITFNGGPIANLPSGTSDSTTFTGTYVLNQNDINSGSVIVEVAATGDYSGLTCSSLAIKTTPLNLSDGIKLIAFFDTNGNGIKDGSEYAYSNGTFHRELNNSGTIHNITSSSGQYLIYETNPVNSYNISFSTNNPNYTVNPSSYSNITVANGSGITTYNFPITIVPIIDLKVTIHPSGGPRPGFIYGNYIYITNYGNLTMPAGTLTFTKDSRVSIVDVSVSATINPTGFTYNYPSLAPNQNIYIYVRMQVPTIPTVNLGDLLTNSVSVDVPSGDINPANNSASTTQEVRGSYDPNDKSESHGPEIVHSTFTSNDYLNYTIQFENTGTAEAITVKVNDLLDSKLDETSIRMVKASHEYTLDRVGNDLTWRFDGINLPPSIPDTTTGKGFINFEVKPKAGYTIGDIINNTAYIYFDFNPAIITNTFATEFVTTLGTKGFVNNQFSAYPNPTTGIINIALKNNAAVIDAIIVTDVLGKTVQTNKVNNSNASIDLSSLSKGLYFVKIQAEGQVSTLKVVKE